MRPRAVAAILLAEGQPAEALAAAEAGLRALDAIARKLEVDTHTEHENLVAMAAEARRGLLPELSPARG
jgi:hypothetical protein